MSAFQQLGAVEVLVPNGPQPEFAFPEHAVITPLLSDGTSVRNALLQSGAPTFREANVSWHVADAVNELALRAYAESKEEVLFTQEDGTSRAVVVMDYHAEATLFDILWAVTCRLIEVGDPVAPEP